MLGEQVMGLLGAESFCCGDWPRADEAYVAGVMDREVSSACNPHGAVGTVRVLAKSGSCALVMDEEKLTRHVDPETFPEFLFCARWALPSERTTPSCDTGWRVRGLAAARRAGWREVSGLRPA